jgi:hypothetical protein
LLIIGASALYWLVSREQILHMGSWLYAIMIIIGAFGLVPISAAVNCMDNNASYKDRAIGLYQTSVFGLVLQVLFILGASAFFYLSISEKVIVLSQ